MGRDKRNLYFKDLHQQAYDRLTSKLALGESKREAKINGTADNKIFSANTYKTYWKHTKYFIKYVKENHPGCSSLDKAKEYVPEWLQSRVDQGLSAWTIQTEAKALGKLYGIKPEDKDYFDPPQRHREDIKRSRVDCVRDRHFSKTNNDELIRFCRGTGPRRGELENMRGRDLYSREQIEAQIRKYEAMSSRTPEEEKDLRLLKDTRLFKEKDFLYIKGKGGRERYSPIIGPDAPRIIERILNTPAEQRVWQHVHDSADIHSYRADYATALYKAFARPIEEIPFDKVNKGTGHKYQSEVYVCRKDEAGRKLDKAAMEICSKALGHNRISIFADNYQRNL